MKKINIKKILLYVSLIPYIYVLIMSLYHAIFGYSYQYIDWNTKYGLDGAWAFIDGFWFDIACSFDYRLFLILLCVIYQIYYAITNKKQKQKVQLDNKKENNSTNKKFNIKKLLYIISIICWVIYFISGIYAYFFGANTGGGLFYPEMEKGIDALNHTLFWNLLIFSYIPVLPITLIYIIIYFIINYRKKLAKGKDVK